MVQRSQMGLLMLQMRLLCTYFGAGTEFVENRYADRRPLQRMLFQDTQGYGIRMRARCNQLRLGMCCISRAMHSLAMQVCASAAHIV